MKNYENLKKRQSRPYGRVVAFFNRYPAVLISVLIFALTCLLYYRTLHFGFINLDDTVYVTRNPYVLGGLNYANAVWALFTFHAEFWHPLTWLSLQLDATLYGTGPAGFHFTNSLLHAFNSVLLFHFLQRMTGRLWPSCFAAVIFACHPLHVESVAWIAERKDVLSGFFWMLTIFFYTRYAHKKDLFNYIIVLVSFFLGLASKPMLVTMPCTLLLLDYWPLNRTPSIFSKSSVNLLLEKIPLFILSGIASFFAVMARNQGSGIASLHEYPLSERIGHIFISYCRYLVNFVWPADLSVYYPYEKPSSIFTIFIAIVFISATSLLAVRLIRKAPHFFVGWFWYLGTLVPVIGIVKFGGFGIADRFMYIPMIGILIIIAWSAPPLFNRWNKGTCLLLIGSLTITFSMTVTSWRQTVLWKDSVTLYTHSLNINNNNALLHNNLGIVFAEKKEFDKAIFHYKEAINIRRNYSDAYYNLGQTYYSLQKYDQAIENYQSSIQSDPLFTHACYSLGSTYVKIGKISKAKAMYIKTLEINSTYAPARRNLELLLSTEKEIEHAMKAMQGAIQNDFTNCLHIHLLTEKQMALQKLLRTFVQQFTVLTDVHEIEFCHTEPFNRLKSDYVALMPALTELAKQCENNAEIYYHLACIHTIRGENNIAHRWFEKASEGNSEFERLHNYEDSYGTCFQ